MVREYNNKTYYRWSKAKEKSKEKSLKWLRIRRNMMLLQLKVRGQVLNMRTRTRPEATPSARATAMTRAEEPKDMMAADLEAVVAAFQALV